VGSYAWGLVGFGFAERGEGRRQQASQMLNWLYGANPTDDERVKLDELRSKIQTGDPYSEDFPNPYDIISVGMIEAYVNGTKDWVGKRGMIGHNRGWSGRMMLKPDRLYHQAVGLRAMQAAMREAS